MICARTRVCTRSCGCARRYTRLSDARTLVNAARRRLTTLTFPDTRREIVHIQAGQCGNQIGAKFWEVCLGLGVARA